MANIIEIILQGKNNTGAAFAGARRDLQGLTGAAGSAATALAGPLVRAVGAFGATVSAVKVGELVRDLGQLGAQSIVTKNSFANVMQSVGLTTGILDQLKTSAGGTITELRLMQLTNTALAGASAELGQSFAQAIPKLIEGARAANQLNPALGDTEFLFQSLVTGIKRGSPMLIDNTGITLKLGEANETMAASLGKTVEQLTEEEKKMAILNATIEGVDRLVQQAGGNLNTLTTATQQVNVAWEELRTTIGEGFAPALAAAQGQLAAFLVAVNEGVGDVIDTLDQLNTGGVYSSIFAELTGGKQIALDLAGALREVGKQIALGGAELQGFAGNVNAAFTFAKAIVGGFGTFFGGVFAVAAQQVADFFDAVQAAAAGAQALMRGDFAGVRAYAGQMRTSLQLLQSGFKGYSGAVLQAGLEWRDAVDTYGDALERIEDRYRDLRTAAENAFAAPPTEDEINPVDLFRAERAAEQDEPANSADRAKTAWSGAGSESAKKWKDEYADFVNNFIADATRKAQGFAKGLFDMSVSGGDQFAPGSNGPFENMFRALDVAKLGDASPWAAQLGLTQEDARRISEDFQRGIFSEGVMSLINVDALVNEAQMAALAEKSQAAFVDAIAKKAGVGNNVVGAMFGLSGGTTGAGGASPAQKSVEAAMTQVAGVLGDTVAGKDFAGRIIGYGENIWGYFEQGITDKAKSSTVLARAIADMVTAAIAGQTGGSVGGAARAGGVN